MRAASQLRRPGELVGWLALCAALTYVAEWVGMRATLPGTLIAVVWPATGIAIAMGIRITPWIAWGMALGDAAFQFPLTHSWSLTGIVALAQGAECMLVAYGVRAALGPDWLDRPGRIVAYALLAGAGVTAATATIAVSAFASHGMLPADGLLEAWLGWWASDLVSLTLVVPLALAWTGTRQPLDATPREIAQLVVAMLAVALALFSLPLGSTFIPALLALPIIAWTAYRGSARLVTLVSATLAVAALGRFLYPAPAGRSDAFLLLEAQVFIAISTLVGLVVVASTRGERARLQAAADREVQAADTARNELLRAFAHELNNPLTPMLLQVELLKDGALGELNREQREGLDTIERSMLRLSVLVHDLRDVGHLQAGEDLSLRIERVDLAPLATYVARAYRPSAAALGVDIEVEAPRSVHVEADVERLEQVLSNVVGNAIKYSSPGGRIQIRVEQEVPRARISVTDEGPGLTPDQLARLYRPFEQVQPAELQRHGTGLGLHIARGILEQHHGVLRCSSGGRGQGATFTVDLPLAAGGTSEARASLPRAAAVGRNMA